MPDLKDYFTLMADYSARTNEAMLAIVAALSPEVRRKEVGSYYKSIEGVLAHLYNSDRVWLQRFRDNFSHYRSLTSSELTGEAKPRDMPAFASFEELRTKRVKLDEVIAQYTAELRADDYDRPVKYVNSAGAHKSYRLWQAVVHMLNHQTHHRGQIAEILDELGVDNDYSNIVGMLPSA